MNRRLLGLLCLLGLLLGIIGPAAAQDKEPNRRKVAELLDEGVARFQAEDYAQALERFEEAHRLSEDPRILYNIAGTLQALGREADAAQTYDQYLFATAKNPNEPKKAAALVALRDLTRHVGRLEIETQPPGSEPLLDGAPKVLGPSRTLYVSPGPHELTLRAQGYQDKKVSFVLLSGEQKKIALTLDSASAPAPAQEQNLASPPRPASAPPAPRRRLWTWIAAGTGAALLGGAVILGLHARSLSDDAKAATCSSSLCPELSTFQSNRDQASSEATASNVLFAGAGAALVGAVILYVYEDRPNEPTPAIAVGQNGWTLGVRGRF